MAIKKATPRPRFVGFKDESTRALLPEPENIPQHLPLFYLLTERGPLDPQMVVGNPLLDIYGSKSFDVRGDFYTHQTFTAENVIGQGNLAYIKRVIPANASRAHLVLSLEIVADDDIPVWERNPDGTIVRDQNGDPQQDGANVTNGYRLSWVIDTVDVGGGETISTVPMKVGTLDDGDGTQSNRYPILGFEAQYGKFGDNIGFRLSAPVFGTNEPADIDVMKDQECIIYRGQFVEKSSTGSVNIIDTVFAEKSKDFMFPEGKYDYKTNLDLTADDLVEAYQLVDPTDGYTNKYGPFESMHVYRNNIETILDLLLPAETAAGNPSPPPSKHLVNFVDGVDINGAEHYGFVYDAASLNMTYLTTHYASGGSDGDIDGDPDGVLGTKIIDEMETNWENPDYPLVDIARFPFSDLYDTGFPTATKTAMSLALGYRPNVFVTFASHDLSDDALTNIEENSIAASLSSTIGLQVESVLYGTAACRAMLVGHRAEKKVGAKYSKPVTLVDDIAVKRAGFAGAGNGNLNKERAYDVSPMNRVDGYKGLNNTFKPDIVKDGAWDAQLNYVQYSDTKTLFWPALQSVYKNETSILNSEIVTRIMCNLVLVCNTIWTELTGTTELTNAQLIERSNRRFNELVDGRYADRVVLEPVTHITQADDARGYSWNMDVRVYGNNMKTVGTFNIIARRLEDLEQ